jgi:hypothetical protein
MSPVRPRRHGYIHALSAQMSTFAALVPPVNLFRILGIGSNELLCTCVTCWSSHLRSFEKASQADVNLMGTRGTLLP